MAWFGIRALNNRRGADIYVPDAARAPAGVRIKVEVLNGTKTRGLARRATLFLRDRGFDVGGSGADAAERAATVGFGRSGHPEWAARVGRAMSAAGVTQ